jgi:uncharacterized protein (TIGR02001 family)
VEMKIAQKMVLAALAVSGGAAFAQAKAPEPDYTLSYNVGVVSDYRYRGISQSRLDPALQGGIDFAHKSGFYLGTWASTIKWIKDAGATKGSVELDLYGGYKGEIAKDFGYDVGLLQYYYPQRKNAPVDFNTTEIYGALTYSWLSLKYSHTVSTDYFGIGEGFEKSVPLSARPKGRNTGYLDLSANVPLIDKLTLNAHLGYTRYASDLRDVPNVGVPNYYDYKLGVTCDLGSGFSVAGAVAGADKRHYYGDINKTRAIVSISKSM